MGRRRSVIPESLIRDAGELYPDGRTDQRKSGGSRILVKKMINETLRRVRLSGPAVRQMETLKRAQPGGKIQIIIRGGDPVDGYNEEFWKALDELVSNSEIVIDRPGGSAHPRFPDFIYKVDYGYLKDTASMDGSGIDVWVGSGDKKIDAIMCIVDLMKRDSEIKILVGCTEEEKREVYRTHNETPYMKGILIRRKTGICEAL